MTSDTVTELVRMPQDVFGFLESHRVSREIKGGLAINPKRGRTRDTETNVFKEVTQEHTLTTGKSGRICLRLSRRRRDSHR